MSRHIMAPLAIAGVLLLVALTGSSLIRGANVSSDDAPPLGAVLSAQDRHDLAAPTVERGADALAVDPAVDLTDPDAVARAYLTAAYSLTAADAGRTHLRAAGYAEPGSPPAAVGVLVLEPPPTGSVRRALVRALDLVAADPSDRRRGYLAAIETTTGPAGVAVAVEHITSQVVLARQPDGHWLVTADSPENPDLN